MTNSPKKVVIVGGGLAGLVAAWSLTKKLPGVSVRVLEAANRAGGVLETIHDSPYLIERSADNFATLLPDALELSNEIGYRDELISPEQDGRQAFVLSKGRILPIPVGFSLVQPTRVWPIATTRTLSWAGKLRMLGEYFVSRRLETSDESLESFAVRRLGREAFDCLVEPIVGGIFTADPSKLSMQATLPQFVKMERDHGGLIRGFLAAKRDDAAAVARRASGARYDQFMAPRQGMSHWIDHLVKSLPEGTLQLNCPVATAAYQPSSSSWQLETAQGAIQADALILANPTYRAAQLLRPTLANIATQLSDIEYASSAVVVMIVDRSEIAGRIDGFGLIVPRIEKRHALAISYTSNKYPGRAPDDQLMMRIFLGGARDPSMVDRDDEDLMRLAQSEVREILGWSGNRCRWQGIVRWRQAMPQYHVGHTLRVAQLFEQVSVAAGGSLRLCGAGYSGVGIPQTIRSARRAAEETARYLQPSV